MSRNVTALFATRAEAEAARARLASHVKIESARVLGKDTAAALDGLSIDAKQAKACRQALQNGDHLLVAKVARGERPAQIIDSLAKAGPIEPESDEPNLSYEIGAIPPSDERLGDMPPAPNLSATNLMHEDLPRAGSPAGPAEAAAAATVVAPVALDGPHPRPDGQIARARVEKEDSSIAKADSQIRIGDQLVARGSSSRASATDDERTFESRAPARRLTDEEVEAGGLLKDRVIEVVEMREEPVIAREVVVREEVIIRKTVNERTETVNETVRRSDVEIEELLTRARDPAAKAPRHYAAALSTRA